MKPKHGFTITLCRDPSGHPTAEIRQDGAAEMIDVLAHITWPGLYGRLIAAGYALVSYPLKE